MSDGIGSCRALVWAAAWFLDLAAPAEIGVAWLSEPPESGSGAGAGSGGWVAEARGFTSAEFAALRDRHGTTEGSWARLFPVYAEPVDELIASTVPPMAGSYEAVKDRLIFRPAFPPAPGMRYRAVLRRGELAFAGASDGADWTAVHRVPVVTAPPTTWVTRITPSASVVPENLLKFYVYFSAPMSRGHIYEHIHLRDAKGKPVELPFLEIDEELWNPELTRLTLFLDPGRIKRGVKPLEEVGPSLEAGHRYVLEVGEGWRDATGRPLKSRFEKTFDVGPPDREPPDPRRWTLHPPPSGTKAALTVAFPEPLDDALARRVIAIMNAASNTSPPGRIELAGDERQWLFVPDEPWSAGVYRLAVGGTLEDLAGNNPGKAFDVDLFEGVQRRIENSVVSVPFEIR